MSGRVLLRLKSVTRWPRRSEEHTSELQSHSDLVCRLLLEKKKKTCSKRCRLTLFSSGGAFFMFLLETEDFRTGPGVWVRVRASSDKRYTQDSTLRWTSSTF